MSTSPAEPGPTAAANTTRPAAVSIGWERHVVAPTVQSGHPCVAWRTAHRRDRRLPTRPRGTPSTRCCRRGCRCGGRATQASARATLLLEARESGSTPLERRRRTSVSSREPAGNAPRPRGMVAASSTARSSDTCRSSHPSPASRSRTAVIALSGGSTPSSSNGSTPTEVIPAADCNSALHRDIALVRSSPKGWRGRGGSTAPRSGSSAEEFELRSC